MLMTVSQWTVGSRGHLTYSFRAQVLPYQSVISQTPNALNSDGFTHLGEYDIQRDGSASNQQSSWCWKHPSFLRPTWTSPDRSLSIELLASAHSIRSDHGHFFVTKAVLKAPTRTKVGDYCLRASEQDSWFMCWRAQRLRTNTSERGLPGDLKRQMWIRMVENLHLVHATGNWT